MNEIKIKIITPNSFCIVYLHECQSKMSRVEFLNSKFLNFQIIALRKFYNILKI